MPTSPSRGPTTSTCTESPRYAVTSRTHMNVSFIGGWCVAGRWWWPSLYMRVYNAVLASFLFFVDGQRHVNVDGWMCVSVCMYGCVWMWRMCSLWATNNGGIRFVTRATTCVCRMDGVHNAYTDRHNPSSQRRPSLSFATTPSTHCTTWVRMLCHRGSPQSR